MGVWFPVFGVKGFLWGVGGCACMLRRHARRRRCVGRQVRVPFFTSRSMGRHACYMKGPTNRGVRGSHGVGNVGYGLNNGGGAPARACVTCR